MSSSTILSQTLQSITVTKIEELNKQRNQYERRKAEIIRAAEGCPTLADKVASLCTGIKALEKTHDNELETFQEWLRQAEYDPTIPPEKVQQCEESLLARLDVGSRRLELADLYSRLLTEWIGAPNTNDDESTSSQSDEAESFELVQGIQKQRLEHLRQKFAKVVFEPLETEEDEITDYLSSLFSNDDTKRNLERLRSNVQSTGRSMLEEKELLDEQGMSWCIKALLKNELLNDEKKQTLREFLKDEAVMNEIRDVLNMRFRNLQDWSWGLGEEGMPVVPRQSLNGKWRVMMDDEVLQALLTHWIGTRWAVALKSHLVSLFHQNLGWKRQTHIPEERRRRQSYYVNQDTPNSNVEADRLDTYRKHFFLAPLPSKHFEEAGGYDDDDDVPEADPDKLSPKDIKQLLLRTLATEFHICRSLDGEAAVVQSDFQWFATGISHTTIFTVLRFIGFQEEWITFFRKALEPPLNMLDGEPVRTRKRGLPMAHIFEKFIGEVVLTFMDLAVVQEANVLLYRFHDDLWLSGKPGKCAKAWESMKKFATVMGLEFNEAKTGSVYIRDNQEKDSHVVAVLPKGTVSMNFLVLDAATGQWVINKQHVQEHVVQLQKQLNGAKSVLDWVKTWNSCIGRFFSYTFGEPANCFGRPHLDEILKTHTDMQTFLFNTKDGSHGTVTKHLKAMITERFDIIDIPDAFLFLDESLGGLGLRNPFVLLFLIRDNLKSDPQSRMTRFHVDEHKEYDFDKRTFERMTPQDRWRRYRRAFPKDDEESEIYKSSSKTETDTRLKWEDAQKFWSFTEHTASRETSSSLLYRTYKDLMAQPNKRSIIFSDKFRHAWREVERESSNTSTLPFTLGNTADKDAMWTVQYHADELFEKCGGLKVLDTGLLPLGVLKALKSRKVAWQMVL